MRISEDVHKRPQVLDTPAFLSFGLRWHVACNRSAMDARRPHDGTVFGAAAEARGYVYVNQFEVGYSRDEVLLRFAQAYEGAGAQVDQARIIMTPSYARALLQLLDSAMARFESEYGELRPAGGGVVSSDGEG